MDDGNDCYVPEEEPIDHPLIPEVEDSGYLMPDEQAWDYLRDADADSLYASSPMSGTTAAGTPYFGYSSSRGFDSISTLMMDEAIIKEGYLAEVTDGPDYRLYSTKYFVLHPSCLVYYRTVSYLTFLPIYF